MEENTSQLSIHFHQRIITALTIYYCFISNKLSRYMQIEINIYPSFGLLVIITFLKYFFFIIQNRNIKLPVLIIVLHYARKTKELHTSRGITI